MEKAFANLSYQGVYLIDLPDDRIIYHSNSPVLWPGFSDEDWERPASYIFQHAVPDEEIILFDRMADTLRSSYSMVKKEIHNQFVVTFNFHINNGNRLTAVNLKLTMIDSNEESRLLLGLISPPVESDNASIIAGDRGAGHYYRYNPRTGVWEAQNVAPLSENELTMLRLSMQGYSMESISKLMRRSLDTVRFYRKQVFNKLNVKNISEAISYAFHYGMI
ncbi:MAG: helix-turn-helix transcriptional regulator [Bacteroidales bacterium]|nr:helix-turn-helix transcriptional regulator [Bacteroidales bacterium]